MPKFPGKPAVISDGNAFAVMAAVRKAMKQNGASKEDIDQYTAEATAGDYDNLLMVSAEYVDINTPDMQENLFDEFEEDYEFEEDDELFGIEDPFAPVDVWPAEDESDDFSWDEDDEDFEDEEFDNAAAR